MKDIEPLQSDLWFARIAMIANGELKNTEHGLRHALHLLQFTPREFRPAEYYLIDEEGFEALLAVGDLDAAARRLVAAPARAVTSKSVGETVEATIACSTTARAWQSNPSAVLGSASVNSPRHRPKVSRRAAALGTPEMIRSAAQPDGPALSAEPGDHRMIRQHRLLPAVACDLDVPVMPGEVVKGANLAGAYVPLLKRRGNEGQGAEPLSGR